ncbi:response regulator transcription factor [Enterococcus faecalis]|uniref:response regulator transcription factor n=1 Tax=Enterococcus TaxID=1350 RepID=UPI001A95996A|nr:response regulator transcription factor [Enterococcus faecalis]MBO1126633.1 response regulator transcription factor [Enterococcus faecalis]
MSYPIILCEDNLVQLQQLDNIVRNYILFHSELLRIELKTQSPEEVKEYLIKFKPKNGIYFLDIDLNHSINGIQLAELIRKSDAQAKIVFITTHDELAPLTLKRKIEALGFVSKDQDFDTYRSEIMSLIELAQKRIDALRFARKISFSFSIGTQMYNINMDDIYFIEPSEIPHRLVLYTTHAQYEFYGKLNDLENKYSSLFRVSRGCLANLSNVFEIDFKKRTLLFDEGIERIFSPGRSRKIKAFMDNQR